MERERPRPPAERDAEEGADTSELDTDADSSETKTRELDTDADSSETKADVAELSPKPAGPRCPFCHDDLSQGELASDCNGCHTLHHVQCFAENRGCATHGCGGHRATSMLVGQAAPGVAQVVCSACRKAAPPGTLVARCRCSRILDVDCYSKLQRCPWAACQGPIELMSHTEAQAANKRRNANIVVGLGSGLLLLPLIFLVLALTGPAREQAEFLSLAGILAAVFSAPTLALWLALHAQAKRLEALPGPRPGGAPAPADGDLGPPSKKGG